MGIDVSAQHLLSHVGDINITKRILFTQLKCVMPAECIAPGRYRRYRAAWRDAAAHRIGVQIAELWDIEAEDLGLRG